MTAVFVHGVPETAGVWDPLKGHLVGDTVTLSLPGFGTPAAGRCRTDQGGLHGMAHRRAGVVRRASPTGCRLPNTRSGRITSYPLANPDTQQCAENE